MVFRPLPAHNGFQARVVRLFLVRVKRKHALLPFRAHDAHIFYDDRFEPCTAEVAYPFPVFGYAGGDLPRGGHPALSQ